MCFWLVCSIWIKLESKEEGDTVDIIQAVRRMCMSTHKSTRYWLHLLPLHCHHNQLNWLLRCRISRSLCFFPSITPSNLPTSFTDPDGIPQFLKLSIPGSCHRFKAGQLLHKDIQISSDMQNCPWTVAYFPSAELICDVVAVIRECNSKIFVAK